MCVCVCVCVLLVTARSKWLLLWQAKLIGRSERRCVDIFSRLSRRHTYDYDSTMLLRCHELRGSRVMLRITDGKTNVITSCLSSSKVSPSITHSNSVTDILAVIDSWCGLYQHMQSNSGYHAFPFHSIKNCRRLFRDRTTTHQNFNSNHTSILKSVPSPFLQWYRYIGKPTTVHFSTFRWTVYTNSTESQCSSVILGFVQHIWLSAYTPQYLLCRIVSYIRIINIRLPFL